RELGLVGRAGARTHCLLLALPTSPAYSMPISRRHFVAGLASAATTTAWFGTPAAQASEGRVISWPSRVVQLPPDDDDHKPPVITAVRVHRGGQWLATAGDDHH